MRQLGSAVGGREQDVVAADFATPPPLATVLRFGSVTDTNTGKFARFEDPDTWVWWIVMAFRLFQPRLYQLNPVIV